MDLYIAMAVSVLLEMLKDSKWVERNRPRIAKIWKAAGIALKVSDEPTLAGLINGDTEIVWKDTKRPA